MLRVVLRFLSTGAVVMLEGAIVMSLVACSVWFGRLLGEIFSPLLHAIMDSGWAPIVLVTLFVLFMLGGVWGVIFPSTTYQRRRGWR